MRRKFCTIYMDKEPTEEHLKEIQKELDNHAPDWGEYSLAVVAVGAPDFAVNMHGEARNCGEALDSVKKMFGARGYQTFII